MIVEFGCAARREFGRRAEPERSEGGWSEAQPNREGVASGSATYFLDCLKRVDYDNEYSF